MKMTREEESVFVMQTLNVLATLNEEEKKEEYRLMLNDLPPSESFTKKYKELYGDNK